MADPFLTDYDSLLQAILTDYKNQFLANGQILDTSQGSLVFIKAAVTAGASWGLHKRINWALCQRFQDQADSNNLEHSANNRDIYRNPGETDAELLARLLAKMRNPPANGNANDYEQWALSISGVTAATCISAYPAPGSVTLLVTPSTKVAAVLAYILTGDNGKPLIPAEMATSALYVQAPTPQPEAMTAAVSGLGSTGSAALVALATEITSYLNGLAAGQTLYLSQLTALIMNAGATNCVIFLPSADVTATDPTYQITAGTVTLTGV